MADDQPSQLDKFKEAARQLVADDDLERFKERLKGLVRRRAAPEAKEPSE